jgi:hypothetical protein
MEAKKESHPFDIDPNASPFEIRERTGSKSGSEDGEVVPEAEPSYKSWTRDQVVPCLVIYAGLAAQVRGDGWMSMGEWVGG